MIKGDFIGKTFVQDKSSSERCTICSITHTNLHVCNSTKYEFHRYFMSQMSSVKDWNFVGNFCNVNIQIHFLFRVPPIQEFAS